MADRSLLRRPLHEVAALVKRREVSPVELTSLSLEAIEQTNPTQNSFRVVMADRALEAARVAEGEIANDAYRGPLHGIPIAVKDLMDVAGETTPAGSIVLADRVATEDSEAVRLLREAGSVIAGKTSMPEFAFSPGSNNQHYGPVPNPWNPEHDSGGSSSGSGAAVASGLVYGATGSDTGGSIRMPATLCGIVGLKPTFGRVSARGAVTLSWSLDHIGPMTRTVRDTAIMLDALAGYDPGDGRTRRVPAGGYADAVEDGVAGLRVALISDDSGGQMGTPAVLDALAAGVGTLEAGGAHVEQVAVPELADFAALYGALLVIEAAAYYEPFLRERPDDLGEFARDRLLLAYAYSPAFFVQGSQARAALRRRIEERLTGYDLVAVPGMPHEAPPLGIVQQNTRYTGPFNALGWPAIVVPVELGENNLPVAIQIAARPWQEPLVLRAGRVVERDGPWQGRLPG
ncbi:MAG TPA: amidase [Thermomicrobiales bacterium]|nr:amidase [Thermomicrobiales bacterium]